MQLIININEVEKEGKQCVDISIRVDEEHVSPLEQVYLMAAVRSVQEAMRAQAGNLGGRIAKDKSLIMVDGIPQGGRG